MYDQATTERRVSFIHLPIMMMQPKEVLYTLNQLVVTYYHLAVFLALIKKIEDISVIGLQKSKIKEDPIVMSLKKAIGEDSFGRVRDIFEHYSAYSGRMHYMDSYEYNKFMKENGFYTDKVPKIKIDLLFSKNNKAKESMFSVNLSWIYQVRTYSLRDCSTTESGCG